MEWIPPKMTSPAQRAASPLTALASGCARPGYNAVGRLFRAGAALPRVANHPRGAVRRKGSVGVVAALALAARGVQACIRGRGEALRSVLHWPVLALPSGVAAGAGALKAVAGRLVAGAVHKVALPAHAVAGADAAAVALRRGGAVGERARVVQDWGGREGGRARLEAAQRCPPTHARTRRACMPSAHKSQASLPRSAAGNCACPAATKPPSANSLQVPPAHVPLAPDSKQAQPSPAVAPLDEHAGANAAKVWLPPWQRQVEGSWQGLEGVPEQVVSSATAW